MPLCPSCIRQHSQYHEQVCTKPQYTNIVEVMADAHAQLNNCISQLEEDKVRNGNMIVQVGMLGEQVKQRLLSAKKQVYCIVQDAFIQLQKQLLCTLEQQHESNDVYSMHKCTRNDELLLKHLDDLYYLRDGLQTEKCLSSIIYFLKEKQKDVLSFHSQLTSYLHVNQHYQVKLDVSSDVLHSLSAVISRLVKPRAQSEKVTGSLLRASIRQKQTTPRRSTYRHSPSPLNKLSSDRQNRLPSQPYSNAKSKYSRIEYDENELSRRLSAMREQNERLAKYLH